jgi:hypothetical protein
MWFPCTGLGSTLSAILFDAAAVVLAPLLSGALLRHPLLLGYVRYSNEERQVHQTDPSRPHLLSLGTIRIQPLQSVSIRQCMD